MRLQLRQLRYAVLIALVASRFAAGAPELADASHFHERTTTLVLMTDTHLDMKCSVDDLEYMARWVADHSASLNIGYVGHLGDVGDQRGSGTLEEMLRQARAALLPVTDRALPFSVAVGNHDYRDDGDEPRSTRAFNKPDTFGPEFYSASPGFGGTYEHEAATPLPQPGGTANHYHVLTLAGEPFLFLTLEYYPRNAVMEWADRLIREHYPDHHIIVSTHAYLTREGALSDSNYGDSGAGPADSNSGAELWERYLQHWGNLRFVFSGHFIDEPRQRYMQQEGIHGNKVHSHFFNYQNWAYRDGELYNTRSGGRYQASVLRLVTIDVDANLVRIKSYLPRANVEVEPARPASHTFR